MRLAKLVRAVLPASLVVAIACGDPASSPTAPSTRVPDGPQLISNGQPTGSAYGGVGVVLIDEGRDDGLLGVCSGSLISPTVFLTAGHCIAPAGAIYYVSFASDIIPLPPASAFIQSTTAFASSDDDLGGKRSDLTQRFEDRGNLIRGCLERVQRGRDLLDILAPYAAEGESERVVKLPKVVRVR